MKTMKSLCGMLAVLAFTACSNDSDEAAGNDSHILHVSLTASMGDATNRALSADGVNIAAKFAVDDEVVVVDADGSTVVGTLKAQTAGGSTTLSGELKNTSLADNEVVSLHYLSATPNYDGQKGRLAEISSYAVGTLKVKTKSPLAFESNSVTLAPQQSITKFTFKDGSSDINVKTFGIAATGLVQSIAANGTETVGAVTGTLATVKTEVYVALRNTSTDQQTYSFYIQDNAGNWYKGTKKATLTNGKNYTATVAMKKLSELSSTEGAVGVIGNLPAIVIDLGGTIGKKAVALMNTGALCPEHYGEYLTFANRASGLSDGWYVPTQAELTALAGKTNAWVTQNGVNGGLFTIGSNTFFLPAAGLDDGDNDPSDFYNVSTFGYYWSSEAYDASLAYCLSFSSSNINSFSDYQIDGLSVRPFHSLP